MIGVKRGSEIYYYSRGHWNNTGSLIMEVEKIRRFRGSGLVDSADQWHTLAVECANGTLSYFYDGVKVRETSLTNVRGEQSWRVGFASYETAVAVKDFKLSSVPKR